MIYQWRVSALVNGGYPCEIDVLSVTEDQARETFEDEISDWSTSIPRIKSITKTGMVLVHESQVKGRK